MKKYKIGFIFLLLVFIFTGCKDVEEDKIQETVPNPVIGDILTYDTSLPVNNGEAISLVFWIQVDYEDLYRPIVEAYTALHPNVSINLVSAAFDDHFNKLQLALPSGLGPDLFHMHNSFSGILLRYMAPYPPEILPYESLSREFRQINQHIINGNLYFIDIGLMTSCILYNKKIWNQEGLTDSDFPETWEQLSSLAQRLTLYDEEGKLLQSGFNPNGQGFALFTAMNIQKGQRLFSSEDKRTPILDTEESRASLSFIESLYEEGIIDINFPLNHESFGAGSTAMIYSWGWAVNWLQKNFPGTEFGTFPTPTWENYPNPQSIDRNNGESSFGVRKYSSEEKKQVAFDFIKFFLASDSFLMDINLKMGTIPTKLSLEEKLLDSPNEYLPPFINIMDRTFYPGTFPEYYEADISNYLIDPVIIDGASITESMDCLERILIPKMTVSSFISLE